MKSQAPSLVILIDHVAGRSFFPGTWITSRSHLVLLLIMLSGVLFFSGTWKWENFMWMAKLYASETWISSILIELEHIFMWFTLLEDKINMIEGRAICQSAGFFIFGQCPEVMQACSNNGVNPKTWKRWVIYTASGTWPETVENRRKVSKTVDKNRLLF